MRETQPLQSVPNPPDKADGIHPAVWLIKQIGLKASGDQAARMVHASTTMGNPSLRQNWHDVIALLLERCDDREQTTEAEAPLAD